jgi:phage terminase large subunit
MEQTTALRKIASSRKKITVVQGGQGASKTFSILMLLINHASNVEGREILILSAELTKMRLTVIKDFVKLMQMFGIYQDSRFISGTLYRFRNGSFIKFIGLDKSDVGKGLRSDVAYFNEVNKIDSETYRQVASRSKKVYADFNPDAEFFIHTEVITREDCDFLKLTFQDNEMLDKGERDEILRYKELGYNEQGEVINKYWANKWRVYGLGEVGAIDGAVFEHWETIEMPSDARLLYYGCDFGYATSKFAVLGIYNWNGRKVLKQFVYKTNLTNQQGAQEFKRMGYGGGVVYCDSAEPKSIRELQVAGIQAVKCDSKQDIKTFAIQSLNEQSFYVDENSTDLIDELRYYVYDEKTGKAKKSNRDHLMDAMLYAIGSGDKYNGKYR